MQRLQNKVAIITGGNSGIGKGIAKRFQEEGAKIVIFGRDQEKLDQTNRELGKQALVVQGDVTNANDLKKLYSQTYSHYGKVDVLVVNSGVAKRLHIKEVTEHDFDYMANVNYRGAFFTVKHGLEYLQPKASIIFISSCAAHITVKRHSVYSSTKAAVSMLAKDLAFDLSDQLIRVNSISPGYIETPIFEKVLEQDANFLKEKAKDIPLRRIGKPEDIGNAAVFLASDEASYITGTDLLVDGGYAASFPTEQ